MRLLLDTHVFLWYVGEPSRLSDDARTALRNSENEVYLSVVSIWETIVKHQIGKLPLPEPPETYLPRMRSEHRFVSLPVDEASVYRLVTLPLIHRDPFDRLLVCQALQYDLTLVTVDSSLQAYPISLLSAE
jgi:PIN domain nuclease of toxin-antitoxin system